MSTPLDDIGPTTADDWDAAWGQVVEEYAFMRSFGMCHARACSRIGVDQAAFTRAALRRGYPIR